ncbi:MAG: MBL fold metallo-hydrolase [Halanaerobiaceae bacterium]
MKFKWWGHATFTITSDDGTRIVTDPYGADFNYNSITDEADIVTVSHDHFDHNGVDNVAGNPEVVNSIQGYRGEKVNIKTIASYHDQSGGSDRGDNIIYIIEAGDKTVAHLGDLGHMLSAGELNLLKGVDFLLIPVGGHFTIDAEEAYELVQQIEPAAVFPMHYKTDKIDLPISGVEPFLNKFEKSQIEKVNDPEIEIEQLPENRKIYVLDYVSA